MVRMPALLRMLRSGRSTLRKRAARMHGTELTPTPHAPAHSHHPTNDGGTATDRCQIPAQQRNQCASGECTTRNSSGACTTRNSHRQEDNEVDSVPVVIEVRSTPEDHAVRKSFAHRLESKKNEEDVVERAQPERIPTRTAAF